jgi:hypothetical protein
MKITNYGWSTRCRYTRPPLPLHLVGLATADLLMTHATPQELVYGHRLGDVLEAVDTWGAHGHRGADVAMASPLTDAVARHTDKLADLSGEIPSARRSEPSWSHARRVRKPPYGL